MSHRLAIALATATALVLAAAAHAATFSVSGSYTTDSGGSIKESLIAGNDNSGPLQFLRESLPGGTTASNITTSGTPADCGLNSPSEIGCQFPSPGLGPGQSFDLLFAPSAPVAAGSAFDVFVCMFPCDNHDYGPFSIAPAPGPGPGPGGGDPATDFPGQARTALDNLIGPTPFASGVVKLGFGVLVVDGSSDGVNMLAFVANAQSTAMDLSVFGFEAQPLVPSGRAASPMYHGKVTIQPGEAKVLKFKPPKKIAAAIRRALRAKKKVTRKITLTYKTATGSQKVTRKFVVRR